MPANMMAIAGRFDRLRQTWPVPAKPNYAPPRSRHQRDAVFIGIDFLLCRFSWVASVLWDQGDFMSPILFR